MWIVLANEQQARRTGITSRPEHLSLVPCSPQLWLVHAAGDWLGLLRQLLRQHGVVGLLKRRVAAVCIGHGDWEPL